MIKNFKSTAYPLLPLRDIIIFPYMVVPLFVGREKSILALEKASKNNNELFLVTQKDANILNPERSDLYEMGTIVNIIQMLKLPDNTVKVLIEGKQRAKMYSFTLDKEGYSAEVKQCKDDTSDKVNLEATARTIKVIFERYIKLNQRLPQELLMSIATMKDFSRLGDIIVAHLNMKIFEKQRVLEALKVDVRLHLLLEKMQEEIEIINIEKKIRTRVKDQMEKSQKEYYLNEQMSAIQKELGDKEDGRSEIQEMEDHLQKKKMSNVAKEKIKKEIKKLKLMSPMSAESAVMRNYIEWVLSLPWSEYSIEDNDIYTAEKMLEQQHYGLRDVKERIIEYLAVRTLLKDDSQGTILCLVGPPGVGKTSIVKSLAKSIKRNFQKISLGGLRDESEIRGHRRTYVGAIPGKIINALKKSETSNPVILLDEIDKMSSDMRGDPASCMLEVLDPEQNKNFSDHYIDIEYDLSKIMFIMTANDVSNIPIPLRDRMEIIFISGYTSHEKLQIAKQYLLKKAIKNNGIQDCTLTISDEIVRKIISGYTREAGVRQLERLLNTICRKLATQMVKGKIVSNKKINITASSLKKYLGPLHFERLGVEKKPQRGLVNGLAWTSVGGELLHIEVITVLGTGKINITGKLGDVMQESAQAALTYVRSISHNLNIHPQWYMKNDIHIHVPEGSIPKDGPSAGVTMVTALLSSITHIKVAQDLAMTGEVTIRGEVLPIGGLKEKLLAAKQVGIKKVLIPSRNKKDYLELSTQDTSGLIVIFCEHVNDVLKEALDISEEKINELLRPLKALDMIDIDSTPFKIAN